MFDLLDSVASFCGGTTPQPVPDDLSKMVDDQVYEDDSKVNGHYGKNNYDAPTPPSFLLPPDVNPMDAKNYFLVQLNRPMGILFEENFDDQYGGAYVAEIKEGYSAAADGSICCGDQLIAIGGKRISGLDFDEVISVMEKSAMQVSLLFFRGPAASLYGPTGASEEWLDLFVINSGGGGEQANNLASGDVGAASGGSNKGVQESADAEARKELLDVVALAVATSVDSQEGGDAMNGDLFKANTVTTGVLNLDADAVDDEMRGAENKLVDVDADDKVKMEAIVEAEEAAPAEADVEAEAEENAEVDATAEGDELEGELEKEVIVSDEAAPLENEGDGDDAALGEDTAEEDGEVESKAEDEAVPEMEAEDSMIIDQSPNHTAMDWLDSYYENTANQTLSTALAAVASQEMRVDGTNVLSFSNIPLPLWEEIKNRESSRQGRGSEEEAVTSAADGAAAPPDTAAAVLVEEEINAAESSEEVVDEAAAEPEMQPDADAPILSVPVTSDSDANASKKDCVDFDSNTADHSAGANANHPESHYVSDDDDDLDLM